MDRIGVDRQHLVHDRHDRIECRLDGRAAVDGNIAVQDLLEHFRVRDEPDALGDQPFERALRVDLVRVRRADQIHRHV